MESVEDQVVIKTAVGSPGFIEMILPNILISMIAVGILIKFVSGKTTTTDGNTATGISALISTVDTLFNDYHYRKKIDAEAKEIEASARLTDAQAKKERAEAERIKAETDKMRAETALTRMQFQGKYEQIKMMPSGKTSIQGYPLAVRRLIK